MSFDTKIVDASRPSSGESGPIHQLGDLRMVCYDGDIVDICFRPLAKAMWLLTGDPSSPETFRQVTFDPAAVLAIRDACNVFLDESARLTEVKP